MFCFPEIYRIFIIKSLNNSKLKTMKKILALILTLSMSFAFAQKDGKKVEITKNGDLTSATYFYADGSVEQQGTFNKEGQLHGVWISYDRVGNKTAIANYANNKKVGKWLFWTNNKLREVEYVDSRIASVNEWENKTEMAFSN